MTPGIRREVLARLEHLELPFNRDGIDPYGVSKKHLARFFNWLGFSYRYYFRCSAFGVEHVPPRGRAMIVCNHSGGYAIDGGMVLAACFFELQPPRLAHGMAEKFLSKLPFAGQWTLKTGQVMGLPQHAARLLESDRLLMVFPEGARGTAKLYSERYSLIDFGTGFMRLAMQTTTPIVPAAFLGGGEAVPTVANLYKLGRAIGAPYVPITPYLLPAPLPVHTELHFGAPMLFQGSGNEEDSLVVARVDEVKTAIESLIAEARKHYHPLGAGGRRPEEMS
jgi:1-acyl-sn-glycerol-3-phosphate acyltransferase